MTKGTIVRTLLLSTLALGALTTAALANEPMTLTDEQMDKVTAGVDALPGQGVLTARLFAEGDESSNSTAALTKVYRELTGFRVGLGRFTAAAQ
jgi:hypothetical protein